MFCQNKLKLLPNFQPGVYALNCSWNATYKGEKKKKSDDQNYEHQQDRIDKNWESSGATEHYLKCHGQFNRLHPNTLSIEARYRSRRIRESLESKRLKCDSSKSSINRDDDNLEKKNKGTPLLRNIKDFESTLHNQISHFKADLTSN